MKYPLLSVVVTIYNGEKNLKKCIDSILSQTFKDFELILVDDGSKDNSLRICREYQKKDNRVNVIHQENGGSVKARKTGLLAAKGEYISYIDCDDWLDTNMYEKMLSDGQNADVIVCGYLFETPEGRKEESHFIKSGCYEGKDLVKVYNQLLYMGRFYKPGIRPALWNKLIRKKMLHGILLMMPDNIRMGDDAAVAYPVILDADKIVIMNELTPYHYIYFGNSLSTTYDSRYFDSTRELYLWLKKELKSRKNGVVFEQLPYYMMYMIQYGIFAEMRARSKLHISYTIKRIKKAVKQSWVKEAILDMDNATVPDNIWKLRESILNDKIGCWVWAYYIRRTWEMITFNKRK